MGRGGMLVLISTFFFFVSVFVLWDEADALCG
jgi:hypothetical protein